MLPLLGWTPVPPLQRVASGLIVIVLLVAEALISGPQMLSAAGRQLQLALVAAAVVNCAAMFFIPGWFYPYSSFFVLLLAMAEQTVGRWHFYQARNAQLVV